MQKKKWTERDFAAFDFWSDNRVMLDAFDQRLTELAQSSDDATFLKKYADFEAFCRAAGVGGSAYWEDDVLTNWEFEAVKNRAAAAKDPRPPRDQILAYIAARGPVDSWEMCCSFPESFEADAVVASLKKSGEVFSETIGREVLYVQTEGVEAKLAALREKQAAHDAELAELQRKHEAGELEDGLTFDAGKIMSDMEEMVVEYGRDHVDGFDEAQTRAMFRKGTDAPPKKKSIFRRLFGK